jgi:hypothetical protein
VVVEVFRHRSFLEVVVEVFRHRSFLEVVEVFHHQSFLEVVVEVFRHRSFLEEVEEPSPLGVVVEVEVGSLPQPVVVEVVVEVPLRLLDLMEEVSVRSFFAPN